MHWSLSLSLSLSRSLSLCPTLPPSLTLFTLMQGALDSGNASIPEDANVHDVAGLLKQYFRELPEPLITSRLFPVFEACYSLSSPPDRQRAVLLACLLLPRTHLQVRLHNPIRSLTVSLSTYYQLLSNYVDTPDFLVIEFNYRQTE